MANEEGPSAPSGFSTQEELDELIREGMNSGEPIEMTTEEWQRLRDEVEHEIKLHLKAS